MMAADITTPPAEMDTSLLWAREIVKTYRGAAPPALNGIDLTVMPGEIVGLLGPNGAGKSTAIAICATLRTASNGQLRLFGRAHGRDIRAARAAIGLVPQEIALYETFTARENLAYFGRMYGLKPPRLKIAVDEALSAVGLTGSADRLVATYSGGMKRRLNLAAGIVHTPRLLFLDEPTVGVDAQSRDRILTGLRRLATTGMGMLYTTHYMEEARHLCHRIVILDQGLVIAEGTPSTLLSQHPDVVDLGGLFLKLTGRTLRD